MIIKTGSGMPGISLVWGLWVSMAVAILPSRPPVLAQAAVEVADPFPAAEIQALLDEVVSRGDSPAIFGALGGGDLETRVFCSGRRQASRETEVTANDLVHIGSCTKAMTSVLLARLVERGVLDWDDTVQARMPDVAARIAGPLRESTLLQLVSHTGRLPANAKNWSLQKGKGIREVRDNIIVDSLAKPPELKDPEAEWNYSNLGYVVAAQMAVHATGQDWETLMQEEVFSPLKMVSAGFGPPGSESGQDQPWGHVVDNEKFIAVYADNPPALGPAGTVHLSLADWVRFCRIFLDTRGPEIPEGYLKPETVRFLTTTVANDYAAGWGVVKRPWAGGEALTHNGSNTFWMATCWVAPTTSRVYIVVLNHAGDSAADIADQTVGKIIAIERRAHRKLEQQKKR